jgi:ATP-dependent RNA helicase DeaD
LQQLDYSLVECQALVLAPTRELAQQIEKVMRALGDYLGVKVHACVGGTSVREDQRILASGVHVVVGTPGRVFDMLRRQSLRPDHIKMFVLDEADEMLRMGFIDDVKAILAATPEDCQRALFSATMPPPIRRIAAEYLGDAQEVRIAAKTSTVEQTEQHYLLVHDFHKLDALTRILEVEDFDAMIIFVRTKSATVELAEKLAARGFAAEALNGDLSQELRERTVERLRKGELDILVATDVAARGLDIERISHVFNYDIPYDPEAYIHRIGRTGRAGREGKAILFITAKEKRLLWAIEKATRQPLKVMTLPTSQQISDQRVRQFQQRLLDTLRAEDLGDIQQLLENLVEQEGLDMSDVATALAYQVQKEQPLFPVLRELPSPVDNKPGRKSRPWADGPRPAMDCYQLAVGRRHNIMPKDIVGAIANETSIDSRNIGRINLYDDHSTVELPQGLPQEVFRRLQALRIHQRPVQLQRVAAPPPSPSDGRRKKGPPRERGERQRQPAPR